jgi:hypothetical protein
MESAIAWVTGPVDVAVLNHHGNPDSTTPYFLSVLRPRVCIAQVWDAQQVDPTVLARLRSDRITPGPRDIFMTNGGWAIDMPQLPISAVDRCAVYLTQDDIGQPEGNGR